MQCLQHTSSGYGSRLHLRQPAQGQHKAPRCARHSTAATAAAPTAVSEVQAADAAPAAAVGEGMNGLVSQQPGVAAQQGWQPQRLKLQRPPRPVWQQQQQQQRGGYTGTSLLQGQQQVVQPPCQHQQQQAGAGDALNLTTTASTASGSSSSSSDSAQQRERQQQQQQHSLGHTLAELRRCRSSTGKAGRAAPYLLTSAIMQCETLSETLQVFCEFSAAFNNVHVSAMVTRLPKIVRSHQQQNQQQAQHQQQQQQRRAHGSVPASLSPSQQQDLQQLLSDLSQLSEELLPTCSPREMSNLAWGFAALGCYSRRLLQLLLGRCPLAALNPQELSNLVWAVASLGHEVTPAWVDEVLLLSGRVFGEAAPAGFKPQEAANLAWGLAAIQRRCLLSPPPPDRASLLSSSCLRVDEAWKQRFCGTMTAQLVFCDAGDIAQGLWALAVLGFSAVEQQWLDMVLIRGLQLLGEGKMCSRDASAMLWAVGKLQQQQQWAAAAAPAGAAGVANSSSSSTVSPILAVFAAAVAAKLPLLLRCEQRPLHFAAVLLHSLQQLQLQPPAAAIDVLLSAVERQLRFVDLSASAARSAGSSRSSSSASSSVLETAAGADSHKQQQQQQQQQPALLLDVSMLLFSLSKLSYRPSQQLLDLAAAVVADRAWQVVKGHDRLAALQQTWQTLQQQQQQQELGQQQQGVDQQQEWADHQQQQQQQVLASRQQQVLQQRQQQLQQLHGTWRGREAALLLWSLGKLRHQPDRAAFLRPVKMASARQRALFSAADVGVLFWALARIRHKPGYAWVRSMLQHFLSRVDDRVRAAADVCNVVHALPFLPGGDNQCRCLRQKLGGQLLQGLAEAAAARFSECGPRELVQLAQGFGLLGFKPGGSWVKQHQQRVAEVGWGSFSGRERAALQRGYAQMQRAGASGLRVKTWERRQQQQRQTQQQTTQQQQQTQHQELEADKVAMCAA